MLLSRDNFAAFADDRGGAGGVERVVDRLDDRIAFDAKLRLAIVRRGAGVDADAAGAADADAAIDDMVQRLTLEIDRIALPGSMDYRPEEKKAVEEMIELCRSRVASFA